MLSPKQISDFHFKSSQATRQIEGHHQRLIDKIAAIEANHSYNDGQKMHLVKEARDATLPLMTEHIKTAQTAARELTGQHRFVASKKFLLSRITANEASSTTLARHHQLARMDPVTLSLTAQNARLENNLAVFAACLDERTSRSGEAFDNDDDRAVFNLETLEIDGQNAALAAITGAAANNSYAESMLSSAMETRKNAVADLSLARQRDNSKKLLEAVTRAGQDAA